MEIEQKCETEHLRKDSKKLDDFTVNGEKRLETLFDNNDGVDRFIEIGPGKTLAGFIRKINREATVINIEKFEDLEKLN